jgi:predicted ATPase
VELAPVADHRLVLAAIAAVVDPAGPTDVGAQADGVATLAASIGARNMLVLLDNFEHVTAAGLQLKALLESCPGLTVLVTSRTSLDLSGEQLFHLRELVLPPGRVPLATALTLDAIKLFQAVARRAQLSFIADESSVDEIVEICRLVHGLPLGIELAAASVGRLSLADLRRALATGAEGVLSGPRDAAPRQRSLRATIEHSWNLLSGGEARALTKLAAFRGGFTWEGASRVAGATIATLKSLRSRSLLSASADDRFDAHPLVTEYARERLLAGSDRGAAALQAHAEYFLELVTGAEQELKSGDQAGALRRLDADLPNLHAALGWLVARAHAGSLAAARAALVMSGSLWQYWSHRGRLSEGRDLTDAALAAAPADELPLERAKALTCAGVLASHQGDEPASEAYNRQALSLRRAAGDRLGEARSLYNLAASAGRSGDLVNAAEYLTSAIAVFRELGDDWSQAFALFNLATLARTNGRPAESARLLLERLRLQTKLGDEAGTAETYIGLGLTGLASGDLDSAGEGFAKALEVVERLPSLQFEVEALEGLAVVAFERGHRAVSHGLFTRAHNMRREHDIGPGWLQHRLVELHAGGGG